MRQAWRKTPWLGKVNIIKTQTSRITALIAKSISRRIGKSDYNYLLQRQHRASGHVSRRQRAQPARLMILAISVAARRTGRGRDFTGR